MDERIGGSFPGGPTRRDPDGAPRRAPRLRRVEDIEERISRRVLDSARRQRAVRVRAGLVVAVALAFAIGVALGRASHTTPEELTEAREAARTRDVDISREVNRTLMELWKMEDAEAARNLGRSR